MQEEELLAHMRLLSSEAKDWKSRVVTEAEEVLCRESAQMAQHATEEQVAMDQHFKAKWQKAEADLQALCQSNSAQVQSLRRRCMRRMLNIKSFMILKRDEYNSRHKPTRSTSTGTRSSAYSSRISANGPGTAAVRRRAAGQGEDPLEEASKPTSRLSSRNP